MTAVIFQPMGNSHSWANGGCSRNNGMLAGSPFTPSPSPLPPSAFCPRPMPFALESGLAGCCERLNSSVVGECVRTCNSVSVYTEGQKNVPAVVNYGQTERMNAINFDCSHIYVIAHHSVLCISASSGSSLTRSGNGSGSDNNVLLTDCAFSVLKQLLIIVYT